MKELMYVVAGIVISIITAIALKVFGKGKQPTPAQTTPTKAETEAIHKATEVLVARADVVATSTEKKEEIKKILEEPDPAVKLARLAEAMKGL